MPHLAALAAVLIALALTGCGSGSKQPSISAKLISIADPICKSIAEQRASANAQLRTVAKSRGRTLRELARLAPGVASYEHEKTHVLESLRESGTQTHSWTILLAGMEALADDTEQLGVQAKANNLKAVNSIIASAEHLKGELGVIAKREGFTYCGVTS
jgi:hypothetical protein